MLNLSVNDELHKKELDLHITGIIFNNEILTKSLEAVDHSSDYYNIMSDSFNITTEEDNKTKKKEWEDQTFIWDDIFDEVDELYKSSFCEYFSENIYNELSIRIMIDLIQTYYPPVYAETLINNHLESVLKYSIEKLGKENLLVAELYELASDSAVIINECGGSAQQIGEDDYYSYYLIAADILKKVAGDKIDILCNLYNKEGKDTEYNGYNMIEASDHFKTAKKYATEIFDKTNDYTFFIITINNLILLHRSNEDWSSAIQYSHELLKFQEMNSFSLSDIAIIYSSLGLLFAYNNEHDTAVSYILKSLENIDKCDDNECLLIIYKNTAETYEILNSFDEAIGYYLKVLQYANDENNYELIANIKFDIGKIHEKKYNFDLALNYYQESLSVRKEFCSEKLHDIGILYKKIGSLLLNNQKYSPALEYYSKAKSNLSTAYIHKRDLGLLYIKMFECNLYLEKFNDALINFEELEKIFSYKEMNDNEVIHIEVLEHIESKIDDFKNFSFASLYHKNISEDDKTLLVTIIINLLFIFSDQISNIENLRDRNLLHYYSLCSKYQSFYDLAIKEKYDYYIFDKQKENSNSLTEFYNINENIKSNMFFDQMLLKEYHNENSDNKYTYKLIDLIQKYERLNIHLNEIENSNFKFRIENQIKKCETEFEYYIKEKTDIKQFFEITELNIIRENLLEKEAMVHYTSLKNENILFITIIRKDGLAIKKIQPESSMNKIIEQIYNAECINKTKLYSIFIEPIEVELTNIEKLIIIPDGELAFIPFDMLRKTNKDKYLCEQFEISLIPSASILNKIQGRNYPEDRSSFIGFGDIKYSEKEKDISRDDDIDFYRSYRKMCDEQLDYLKFTKAEIEGIAMLFNKNKVKLYKGIDASEKNVFNLSKNNILSNYNFIHFACHGLYDSYFPLNTGLQLAEYSFVNFQETDPLIIAKLTP